MNLRDLAISTDTEIAKTLDEMAGPQMQIARIRQIIWQHEESEGGHDRIARRRRLTDERLLELNSSIEKLQEVLKPLQAKCDTLEEVRSNNGNWPRFFLVTSSDGHVHSSTHCGTCFSTTAYGWLPELSGAGHDEAIEEWGEKMCTVCFPDAPVNPRFREPCRRDQAAIAARQAEKAEREAAKTAKGITMPDGSPLFEKIREDGRGRYPMKTERAATNMISGHLQDRHTYEYSHPSMPEWEAFVLRAVIAVAHKRGTTPREELDLANAKVLKKLKAADRKNYRPL